jgi:hypothetical protein
MDKVQKIRNSECLYTTIRHLRFCLEALWLPAIYLPNSMGHAYANIKQRPKWIQPTHKYSATDAKLPIKSMENHFMNTHELLVKMWCKFNLCKIIREVCADGIHITYYGELSVMVTLLFWCIPIVHMTLYTFGLSNLVVLQTSNYFYLQKFNSIPITAKLTIHQ